MNRLSQIFKVCLVFLFAMLSSNLLPAYAAAYVAPNTNSIVETVTICHGQAAQTGGSHSNPYVPVTNNVNGILHGHADTDNFAAVWFDGITTGWGDIIPPFTYQPAGPPSTPTETFGGLNWTTEGQAIYAKDCETGTSVESTIPAAPTVNKINKCGIYGSVVLPNDTDLITYSVTTSSPKEGEFTVTATPANNVTLDVTGTNYTLQQNGKATVAGNLGTYSVCEEAPTLVECEGFPLIKATNKNLNGWTLSDNASFVKGGVKLSVTGDWDTTTITRTLSGELRDLGTGIDFTPNEDYLGLHVETSKGTLTYEKFYENQDPANAGKWWSESDFGVSAGQGYATFDTLENIVAANPDVTLENLRVLYTNPNPASVIVASVKIGCHEYTFDYERDEQPCSVKSNTYRDVWLYDGATYPEAVDYTYDGVDYVNNGTFNFTNEGLHISTPDTDSYVYGLFDGGKTPLADIGAMSYQTYRKAVSGGYEGTLPAYILLVDTNGSLAGGETYFFYEPYNNGTVLEDKWQTWDAINGGNAKWWMSGTGQKLQTWDYFVDKYPEAVVLAYGFNQGTSNSETYAIIQNMTFDCATTNFAAPQVLGDDDVTPVPVTPTVQGVATTATLPAKIPATGSEQIGQMGILAGIVLSTITYLLTLRRQKPTE